MLASEATRRPARPAGYKSAGMSWLDACLYARDRLLASDCFRRWAAKFPLTRPIARRRARALFDLCAGFVYSQVLLACVRLNVFEQVAENPQTAAELASKINLAPDATQRLLDAAVSLRLLERRRRKRFGLGPLGAALIGNPGINAMIEHHPLLYADLGDPVALLRGESRTTALGQYWRYADTSRLATITSEHSDAYTALMSASQPMIADEVLAAYPLRQHRYLLDVGGGDGCFLISAAARAHDLRLMLFDLPSVAARAEVRFERAGLADRAMAVGGDFRADALPQGADIVSLIRIVHDHDDATALALLRAVRLALPEGGTLLLAEPMSGTRGAEPVTDAYFGFYLLSMGRGRPRTPTELERLVRAAGFQTVKLLTTRVPMLVRVMVARC